MVSGSDLWLETLLQRRRSTSYISAKTVCPPKLAASSVAAGPYSNTKKWSTQAKTSFEQEHKEDGD